MKLRWRDGRPDLDLDALPLTPAQRAAVDAPAPVVVTAGAGSGKTHTLSVRYLRGLLAEAWEAVAHDRRPEIGAVRLLTFTDQAAREMRERAGHRLVALRDAAAVDPHPDAPRLRAALDALVASFPSAHIGTFHAWCATILRDRPDLSRVPSDARILDDAGARALLRDVATEALDAAITADPGTLPGIATALPTRRAALDALARLIEERHRLGPTLAAWADGRVDEAAWVAAAPLSPADATAWLRGTARPLVARLCALLAPGSGGLRDRLGALEAPLGSLPTAPLAVYALYGEALAALLVGDGSKVRSLPHPSAMGKKAGWRSPDEHRASKAALQVLDIGRADWLARARVASGLPTAADARMAEALGPLLRVARDAIIRLGSRFAAERTLDFSELLGRAAAVVAADPSAAGTYREVLVDEFQDTDPIQWGLVRALGARVFLVGDAKQAIYGFRGGDVGVFRVAADELGAARLGLPDNFRTRPAVIAVLNRWLAAVLGPDAPDRPRWEAPFEALAAARTEAGGTVRVALGPPVSPDADAERTSAWIADDIADRLDDPEIVAAASPPIAILLRARTRLGALEAALRRRGVPYVVAGGVGFWSRPAVIDAVNALRVVASDDPIAALGHLRSPAAAVPDDLLFAWAGDDAPARLRRLARGDVDPGAPAPIVEAAARIASWRRLAPSVPAPRLLDVLLSDGGAVTEAAEAGDAGALANLDRLRDRVAELAARGASLPAIAADLADRVARDEREGEAPVDPGRARVVVMTVHAAKGLEFPIVYVPGAGERARPVPETVAIAREDAPPAAMIAVPCGAPPPGLLVRLRAQARVERLAEERRLLYVALTRARDHLVVVGTIDDGEADTPLGWLRDGGFGDDVEVHALPAEVAPVPVEIDAPAPLPTALPPSPWPTPPIEIAPWALDAFAACPARWWRRHVAGEHERGDLVDDPVRRLAGVRGEVLHGLLEDGLIDDEEVAWRRLTANALGQGIPREAVEASRSSLARHLGALRDPRLRRALDAPGRAEVAFRVARGPIVLVGQIDRLWLDGDAHVVFDLKSGAADAPDPGASDTQVSVYAWAADRLLRDAGLPGVGRAELFFSANGAWRTLSGGWRAVEAQLDAVAATAALPWPEVEALATASPRACEGCGFRGKGCRGWTPLSGDGGRRDD